MASLTLRPPWRHCLLDLACGVSLLSFVGEGGLGWCGPFGGGGSSVVVIVESICDESKYRGEEDGR